MARGNLVAPPLSAKRPPPPLEVRPLSRGASRKVSRAGGRGASPRGAEGALWKEGRRGLVLHVRGPADVGGSVLRVEGFECPRAYMRRALD